ncbi:hypothetical protein [Paenarthrobacter sp. PH39-S1]|uniref:hypothetical protein n=1 Tax=Paenarthrobacter sp. PH39-S1 TaxID=3046204 RepID=UPI0024B8DE72|nr:hypothetical protein [Paenarthrobacter sp. PH39-S1]MDJ0356055.1 hypothetical protein [Paenarthrobacter sp. PH39-S1]
MSTAVLDRKATVHKEPSTDAAAGFRAPTKPFSPQVDAAIDRIVAAAPPLSQSQRDRLAAILSGGA